MSTNENGPGWACEIRFSPEDGRVVVSFTHRCQSSQEWQSVPGTGEQEGKYALYRFSHDDGTRTHAARCYACGTSYATEVTRERARFLKQAYEYQQAQRMGQSDAKE